MKKFLFCNIVPCMSCAIWCETSLISSGSILNIMCSDHTNKIIYYISDIIGTGIYIVHETGRRRWFGVA